MSDDQNECYGPSLPPSLSKNHEEASTSPQQSEGPSLPPSISKSHQSQPQDSSSSSANSHEEQTNFGPALPPTATQPSTTERPQQTTKVLGPMLPPGFSRDETNDSSEDSDDDVEEIVGPLPPDQISVTALALEQRALEIKLSKLSDTNKRENDTTEQREEWMMVPPEMIIRAGLAKSQAKFSQSRVERNRDQSSWTETPEDKRRKAEGHVSKSDQKRKLNEDAERLSTKKRDEDQERIAKKLKKQHKRDKSLLDLHTEKRKNEKDNKPTDQTRRPFSRDTDLAVSKFDARQVKSVIDKAKILDSRFSSGSNKYL